MVKWRGQWQPTPVLLPGKFHGRRSLVGCSPWGHKGSDMTERLHFHFSLYFIGEGNGNPLQCSWLENPRDGGAYRLLSMGSHRVRHDWSNLAAAAAAMTYNRLWKRIYLHICVCTYVFISHFAAHLKYCKSTILQLKNFKREWNVHSFTQPFHFQESILRNNE